MARKQGRLTMKPMSPVPKGAQRRGVKLVVRLFSSATIPTVHSAIPPLTKRVRLTASTTIQTTTVFLIKLGPQGLCKYKNKFPC